MTDEIQAIIDKARDLSDAIRGLDSTRRYEECRRRMQNDRTASALYTKLVSIGDELNAKIARGESIESKPTSEGELLKQELNNNALVKDFIMSQKEYLDIIKQIVERIKNPVQR